MNIIELQDDRDIQALIDKIGWKRLIDGLTKFAISKRKNMKIMKFWKYAHEWEIIEKKISSIRKRVQM